MNRRLNRGYRGYGGYGQPTAPNAGGAPQALPPIQTPQEFLQDFLAPLTGREVTGSGGQVAEGLVSSMPQVQATLSEWMNPQNLTALTRKVARLEEKLARGGMNARRTAVMSADLDLARSQLAQLRAALLMPSEASQIQAVSTVSYGWIPLAILGAVGLGVVATLLRPKRRRR